MLYIGAFKGACALRTEPIVYVGVREQVQVDLRSCSQFAGGSIIARMAKNNEPLP